MIGDLHCHTRLSDGSMGIDDILFYAKRAGLDFISITDHDTLAGYTRAAVVGKRIGINIIQGVEFSCYDQARKRKVHILCYMPDKPNRLEGISAKILKDRNQAGVEMANKIMQYYPITFDHIMRHSAGSKAIYKSHIMNALMDLGYTSEIYGDLFKQLLATGEGSCYVEFEYPNVINMLGLIHSAQGIAVMAHPGSYNSFELLEELAEKGLIDGVEADYPTATADDKKTAYEIAEKYKLIKTGGTDFHGYYRTKPQPLGTCITNEQSLNELFRFDKTRGNKANKE